MTQYQYSLINIKCVQENPEEYIIPDCLEACKILWRKGINTSQCSNLDDKGYRWIEIDPSCLSEENKKLIYDMINSKIDGFTIGGMTHYPRLFVYTEGIEAQKKLCELAGILSLQDTNEFMTVEEYLDTYKRKDGEYILLDNGNIKRSYNPKYINATLEEAINDNGDWGLYIEDEGRIYNSQYSYNQHIYYLSKLKKISQKR